MILRRIKAHVENENWFAVFIDFCIVVIGVFIGIQVANWNEARAETQQALAYTARLHDDVINLMETRRTLIEVRASQFEHLADAATIVINETAEALTDEECGSIAYVQSVSNPTDDLGTLIELQSSGQLSILKDPDLRSALQDYLLARARSRDSQRQISRVVEPLLRLHPDMIQVVIPSDTRPAFVTEGLFSCDLVAMRESDAFKNDLEIAQLHFGIHVGDNARITQSLEALHAALDKAMDIRHGETTP